MATGAAAELREERERLRAMRLELIASTQLVNEALAAMANREELLAERDQMMVQKGAQAVLLWLAARGQLRTPRQRIQATLRGDPAGTVDVAEPVN